jgi:uncharacterized membrane protein YwaF
MKMTLLLGAISASIGVAVANGRPGLVPFAVLVLLAYVVARRSDTRPGVIAASGALPAVVIVVTFGDATVADAWPFHLVTLVVLAGLSWLVAQRAQTARV